MIRSQNAFGEVRQKDIWMPVGSPLSKGAPAKRRGWNLAKFGSIDQPQSTYMNLIGELMRENVKVGLPFPPGLVISATQAFIKGARAVLFYSGMSLGGAHPT